MTHPSLSAAGGPRAVGVLLVNLGTPDGPDFWSVRRYLREFLSDRRVVEAPPLVWRPILELVILNSRPWRSAKAYRAIWNEKTGEGPLKAITRAQAEKLAARAAAGAFGTRTRVTVDFAMRYGNPSIASRLEALQAKGCDRILVAPLYPQYAAATNASVNDAVFEALGRLRAQPALRVAAPYYDDPAYIEALADSVRAGLARLDFEPDVILASFHGIPQAQIDKGDPYRRQCETTWRLLCEALGASPERLQLTFQSRFGRIAEWTGPHTNATASDLARRGVERLAVVTPGFSADCLETIGEIGVEIRDLFLSAGGEKFARFACLNDSDEGMRVIETLAKRELSGWM